MGAFVVPLLPDKVEAWKQWTADLQGPRRSAFEAFNQQMGLTTHRAWLTEDASGRPAVIVLIEGPGAPRFLERMGTERDPFVDWFRERVRDLHGLDPSVRLEDRSRLFLDWHEHAATV